MALGTQGWGSGLSVGVGASQGNPITFSSHSPLAPICPWAPIPGAGVRPNQNLLLIFLLFLALFQKLQTCLFSSPHVPPSNHSAAAPAARPGTDLVQPKGCHEMCISEELPEERINSLTWDGKECWGRHHVTECASCQNRPSRRGLLNEALGPHVEAVCGPWAWGLVGPDCAC